MKSSSTEVVAPGTAFITTLITGIIFASVANSSLASGFSYLAEMDESQWTVQRSVFECSIVQRIPSYGEAVFYHQAGEGLTFYLNAKNNAMKPGQASLISKPPIWRSALPEHDIGFVPVQDSHRPISIGSQKANQMMSDLIRGMVPTMTRRAHFDDNQSIQVAVSPVHFKEAYAQYQDCVADLLPVNFDQIRRSRIEWKPGQMELDAQSKVKLNNIAIYARADPTITEYIVSGFSDTVGERRENYLLSEKRAFAVTNYLIGLGIDQSLIGTHAFGEGTEGLLVANEKTAADRNRNRRVQISILRE